MSSAVNYGKLLYWVIYGWNGGDVHDTNLTPFEWFPRSFYGHCCSVHLFLKLFSLLQQFKLLLELRMEIIIFAMINKYNHTSDIFISFFLKLASSAFKPSC